MQYGRENAAGRDEDLCEAFREWGMPEEAIAEAVGADVFVAVEPELFDENVDYMRAFWDLSTSRPIGFGVGSIPVSEIGAYWDRAPLDGFLPFLRRIRAADDAFMKWQREERDKKAS